MSVLIYTTVNKQMKEVTRSPLSATLSETGLLLNLDTLECLPTFIMKRLVTTPSEQSPLDFVYHEAEKKRKQGDGRPSLETCFFGPPT